MRVLKFGGTSMGDEHTWRQILDIIATYQNPVIIVSATARTTRQLVAAGEKARQSPDEAKEIAQNIRDRHVTIVQEFLAQNNTSHNREIEENCLQWIDDRINNLLTLLTEISSNQHLLPAQKDAIASVGEQLSAYLFAQCGRAYGLATSWIDARRIMKTDSNFGQAIPNRTEIAKNSTVLSDQLSQNNIPVMGGFYGETADGQITTLGFEGSDYTASLVGAALQAEAIEIWTDVSGIYTSDPRAVQHAQPISELSFQEATELAYFGAKVLHPSTMKPVADDQIPVYVKNIFDPDHPGTKISAKQTANGWTKAVAYLKDIIILTVTANKEKEGHQFLAEVFEVLNKEKRAVHAVTTTEASVSVALTNHEMLAKITQQLGKSGAVSVKENQGLISLIGCNFENIADLQARVFAGIGEIEASLISYSKSKKNLNIAVSETDLIPAVCRIHDTLFEPESEKSS